MIQIGAQRAGQIVVCPQCGERLTVPAQSVAQAETLYQFLKQKRLAEKNVKTTGNLPLQQSTQQSAKLSAQQSVQQSAKLPLSKTVPEKKYEEIDEEPNFSLEELDTEDVDRWIKEFWTTQSKENNVVTEQPHTAKPVSPPANTNNETAAMAIRQHETWLLFRTWLIIVFLFGLVGGFSLCLFINSVRKNISENNNSAKPVLSEENVVTGKLYYRGFDGERIPDADAVVMLLPLDRIPTFPISGSGLRPDDNHHPATEDSIQQIKEIGGMFQRTDADGLFSIQYENKGRYLILMISSHTKRSDAVPDAVTIRELKRFFRNPQELLSDYSSSHDEYELDQGKYIIRQTF
ncbi:MAG: hypothetical protein LBP87_08210 [Planctomycetaceae bacterium]|jgi:hypothetical protein|nr:hypothetical protein [Planctomycetaceae bacterium]